MSEAFECPRCHRRFGGEQAYRAGHRRQGRPRRETCRRVGELRRNVNLRLDGAGVWHLRASTDPGQLRLPIFGRGRPRKAVPIISARTRSGRTYLGRPMPRRSPIVTEREAA